MNVHAVAQQVASGASTVCLSNLGASKRDETFPGIISHLGTGEVNFVTAVLKGQTTLVLAYQTDQTRQGHSKVDESTTTSIGTIVW
jgi:hypothetical protein